MTKHTPGPWKALFPETNGHIGWSIESSSQTVATVYVARSWCPREPGDEYNHPENQESVANARLIASAPELLSATLMGLGAAEALELVCEDIPELRRYFPGLPNVLKNIRAAIAKATEEAR